LGVDWPGTFGGGEFRASFDVLGGSVQSATAAITDQALPRLDLGRYEGWAKILRQAAVVTANGAEASLSGGGEVNIPVRGALAADIRSIEFGSTLKVLPRYDQDSGRIELAISAQVSDLTEDGGTGAPGRATANVQTLVNLELGQSVVLGGLTARSVSRSRSGIPGLSQIPIVGILFGTTSWRRQESDNVVLIVPTVMNPLSLAARDRIREALRAYVGYDGKAPRRPLFVAAERRSPGGETRR
jgi:pilus assembly protein CpaC